MLLKYTSMGRKHHVCCVILFVLLFWLIIRSGESFSMPDSKKIEVVNQLVMAGKPTYNSFRSRGLDGTHYYDAYSLWTNKKYTKPNLVKIITP